MRVGLTPAFVVVTVRISCIAGLCEAGTFVQPAAGSRSKRW